MQGIAACSHEKTAALNKAAVLRDPAGARTQDPNIKSVVLYQLSYGISVCQNENRFRFGGANVRIYF